MYRGDETDCLPVRNRRGGEELATRRDSTRAAHGTHETTVAMSPCQDKWIMVPSSFDFYFFSFIRSSPDKGALAEVKCARRRDAWHGASLT